VVGYVVALVAGVLVGAAAVVALKSLTGGGDADVATA
jgi:hypothetical protein